MNEKVYSYMDWPRIEALVYAEESAPKDVMSPRLTPDGVLIQGFFPDADAVQVLSEGEEYEMEKEDEAGYYAVLLPGRRIPSYRFRVTRGEKQSEFYDSYAYPCQITEEEEKRFCAGTYYQAYEKLGAHPMTVDGVEGTFFAVWAPNAVRVSVVGDFNEWDGRRMPMHRMPMSGIFELFVPGVKAGELYKYEIRQKRGTITLKADPYANATESAPAWAGKVADLRDFVWNDAEWLKERAKYDDRCQPVSIYETDLTKWESAEALIAFVSETGYTHVEFHPVMEYLDDNTGAYSTSSYFAPTTRQGSPTDFQKLVNGLHQAGIGVILDWTPAQFPRFEGGLELFDGTPLYEKPNTKETVHPKWGTLLYNYESPMVKDFLISNACYWMEVYHVDGLRMDDVDAMLYLDYGRAPGEWTPNFYGSNENIAAVEFLKHLNSIVKKKNPGVLLIAQEDGLWPQLTDSVENDHTGFDYKWSGGWTKDFLTYLAAEPKERKRYHDQLTLSMVYAYSEHYVLTLGTRDVGSMRDFLDRLPGTKEEKLAQLREAYTYQTLHPGCKMTASEANLPEGMSVFLHDLNALYKEHPALYVLDSEYDGFEWIQLMKYEENILTFLRKAEKPEETLLAVFNFSPDSHEKYQTGVPFKGKYKEIFNSDDKKYGGSSTPGMRAKSAKKEECDEREYSITIKVPAFGAVIYTCTPEKEKETTEKPAAPKKRGRKPKKQ
jgi:1,4-alpha-glucan branching enzyme